MAEKKYLSFSMLLPLLMAIFIDIMGFGLVYPLMTVLFTNPHVGFLPVTTSPQLRDFYLGLGYMIYPLLMFFGASFLGDLSDRWGRKRTLIVCMCGIAVGYFCMSIAVGVASVALFILGRAISGLLAGCQPVAQATIADLSQDAVKARNMGFVSFIMSLGLMIGPLIGGFFSEEGYWTPFFVAGILSLLTALWIVISFSETHKAVVRKPPLDILRPLKIFKEAFQMQSLCFLCPIFILMQLGFGMFFQFIVVQLQQGYGYSTLKVGLFNGYLGIFFSFGLLVGIPILVKRFIVEKIGLYNLLISAIMLILLSLNRSLALVWIFGAVLAVSNNIAFAMLMTTFSNQVGEDRQGWVMGIFSACVAVSFTIAGLMADLLPYLGALGLIGFGGGVYFLATFLMFLFNRTHPLHGPHGAVIK